MCIRDRITYSAALAFYFVLSLPALLLFSVSVGSIFLKSQNLQDTILNYLQGVVDESIINMITVLFEHIPEINSLSIGSLVGFLLLLWSASNIFRPVSYTHLRAQRLRRISYAVFCLKKKKTKKNNPLLKQAKQESKQKKYLQQHTN